ncbi:MAG TPA: amidophosphoribosyltransferase [bacterium]|nr:amidophosphoribosyltransferase [bacterium]
MKERYYPKEACGVFGIFGHPEAATLTYLGIYALQHRGQESAGIVASDGTRLRQYRALGLVNDVFREEVLRRLTGYAAIGHVRYSTLGDTSLANAQPVKVDYLRGSLAVCHNGNVVNALPLREELEQRGSIFTTTSDSEIIIHLIAHDENHDLTTAIPNALGRLEGAYSVLFLEENRLVAARDPHGWRPLCLGTLGNAFVVASETCAFDLVGAKYERDIEPGEIVEITSRGVKSLRPFEAVKPSMCIFELVYFSRPDSYIFGRGVYEARKTLGAALAREEKPGFTADMVIAVPDSSNSAALGYADESGIPFELGIIRSHYIGRTFIEPEQRIRAFGTRLKYNPVRDLIAGKSLVIVDDSIVRGTTSRKIIDIVRNAGAGEIHLRISCPPWRWPCFYGIDTPTREELIGSRLDVDEIARYIGVDSLKYLSLGGLRRAIGGDVLTEEGVAERFCSACFTGEYPTSIYDQFAKDMMTPRLFGDKMF